MQTRCCPGDLQQPRVELCCDNTTLAKSNISTALVIRAKQLAFADTVPPTLEFSVQKGLRLRLGLQILPRKAHSLEVVQPLLLLTPLGRASLIGQGRDPSHSLGDTFEARWGGSSQKSQTQWGPMEHGPNSPQDHSPHCYYFLIKMASFSLITKATSVYFSKIRQGRPGKRKIKNYP